MVKKLVKLISGDYRRIEAEAISKATLAKRHKRLGNNVQSNPLIRAHLDVRVMLGGGLPHYPRPHSGAGHFEHGRAFFAASYVQIVIYGRRAPCNWISLSLLNELLRLLLTSGILCVGGFHKYCFSSGNWLKLTNKNSSVVYCFMINVKLFSQLTVHSYWLYIILAFTR